MAEKLPVGVIISSKIAALASTAVADETSNLSHSSHVPDLNCSNGLPVLDRANTLSTISKSCHSEVMSNGSQLTDADATVSEWVEQDEPGVYITLTSLPGGGKDLKRVRFRYMSSHFTGILL